MKYSYLYGLMNTPAKFTSTQDFKIRLNMTKNGIQIKQFGAINLLQ